MSEYFAAALVSSTAARSISSGKQNAARERPQKERRRPMIDCALCFFIYSPLDYLFVCVCARARLGRPQLGAQVERPLVSVRSGGAALATSAGAGAPTRPQVARVAPRATGRRRHLINGRRAPTEYRKPAAAVAAQRQSSESPRRPLIDRTDEIASGRRAELSRADPRKQSRPCETSPKRARAIWFVCNAREQVSLSAPTATSTEEEHFVEASERAKERYLCFFAKRFERPRN